MITSITTAIIIISVLLYRKLSPKHRVIYLHPVLHSTYRSIKERCTNELFSIAYKKHLLSTEFKKLLLVLQRNGYTLGDSQKLLNLNKKEFVLTIDDPNYYPDIVEAGSVKRIELNQGKIVGVKGTQKSVYLSEISILEQFIEKKPQFDINNNRGILATTGFNGILGHELSSKELPALVKELKRRGWKFSCHGYSHHNPHDVSIKDIHQDCLRWLNEVSPLVGETSIYTYPYGIEVPKQAKKILHNLGFNTFLSIGNSASYSSSNPNLITIKRIAINGESIKNPLSAFRRSFRIKPSLYSHPSREKNQP